MNKTIIININGTVFHIEENAYEILKQYMTAVKRHFFNSADSLEITTDIENRIAELFTEILEREGRQAIVEQDVNYVIRQMGAVEDFEGAGTDGEPTAYFYPPQPASSRRLFRDPDNHLIGGVCAGIANYFDIQAVWVRLAFVIAFAFFGTGLFLYAILWLVIPRAITRSDKMAMKGEKLNLEGFKRNFEEELSSVRTKVGTAQLEAQPFIYRFRDFIQEFFTFVGNFLKQVGSIILKLLALGFLLTFFGLAISLIVMLVMVLGFGQDLHDVFPFSVIGYHYDTWMYLMAFIVCIIPLVGLILLMIRVVFKTTYITKPIGSTLGIVWICALSIGIYLVTKVAANFRRVASFDKTVTVKPTKNNTYYLELNNVKYLTAEDSARLDLNSKFRGMIVTNDNDDNEPRNVWINIERSDVPQPVLVETYRAKGKTYEAALLNARNTQYNFMQQDSVLKFDYKLHRTKQNEPWHNEEIELTLKLPLNAVVVIDKKLQYYTNTDVYNCLETNKTPDAPSAKFIMKETGLECKVDTLLTDTVKRDTVLIAPDAKVK